MTQYISTESSTVSPNPGTIRGDLQQIAGNAAAYRTDLANDTQTMPPFQAMDALDAEVAELDRWVSNFIGRIQPYCVPVALNVEAKIEGPAADLSPFEQRIVLAQRQLHNIRAALDEMNQGLRL